MSAPVRVQGDSNARGDLECPPILVGMLDRLHASEFGKSVNDRVGTFTGDEKAEVADSLLLAPQAARGRKRPSRRVAS